MEFSTFINGALLQLCPVNLYRPTFPDRITLKNAEAYRDIFEDALAKNLGHFNTRLQEIYDLPNTPNVKCFVEMYNLYESELKNKILNYDKLILLNKYGCVFKTSKQLYSNLHASRHGQEGGFKHTCLGIYITITLVLYCMLTCFKVSENRGVQIFYCMAVNCFFPTIMFFIHDFTFYTTIIVVLWTFVLSATYKRLSFNWQVDKAKKFEESHIVYYTWPRGILLIGTFIAIFAVDSVYFNHHHSKTFFNGFSPMDIGAAGFTMHVGALMALPKVKRKFNFVQFLKRNLVLVALGIGRWLATTWVDYNVVVDEYGIHWNFFLSLAMTKAATEICINLPEKVVYALPVVIVIVMEYLYIKFDAVNVLPLIKRTDIITANKEGIISIPNHLAISLVGYITCKWAVASYRAKQPKKSACIHLILTVASYALSFVLYCFGFPSSRTLCNARYVLNICSVGHFTLIICLLFDMCFPDEMKSQSIVETGGKYSLHVFLLGNLLVGGFNKLFYSLLLPKVVMITVVMLYAAICLGLSLVLSEYKF